MKKISALLLLSLFSACTTVPITGRRQLALIPNSQVLSMSFSQYKAVLKDSKPAENPQYIRQVQTVGKRIENAVKAYFRMTGDGDALKDYRWEYHVIESPQLNAWCMPGGKIAFYSGILPVCGDDAGIAVVMGHEVAHAVAGHGRERMSQMLAAQGLGTALGVALAGEPQKTRQMASVAFGLGLQVGVLLPFSRSQEREADRMGLVFMALAGYNPRESIAFWQRMQKASGSGRGQSFAFLATHPLPEQRIRDLKRYVPEAMRYYHPHHPGRRLTARSNE